MRKKEQLSKERRSSLEEGDIYATQLSSNSTVKIKVTKS